MLCPSSGAPLPTTAVPVPSIMFIADISSNSLLASPYPAKIPIRIKQCSSSTQYQPFPIGRERAWIPSSKCSRGHAGPDLRGRREGVRERAGRRDEDAAARATAVSGAYQGEAAHGAAWLPRSEGCRRSGARGLAAAAAWWHRRHVSLLSDEAQPPLAEVPRIGSQWIRCEFQ